jgi:uncharacterized protein
VGHRDRQEVRDGHEREPDRHQNRRQDHDRADCLQHVVEGDERDKAEEPAENDEPGAREEPAARVVGVVDPVEPVLSVAGMSTCTPLATHQRDPDEEGDEGQDAAGAADRTQAQVLHRALIRNASCPSTWSGPRPAFGRRLYATAMLEMRPECERCGAPLAADAVAFICSYECTWCERCAKELADTCPNCGGELVRRPRRTA